MPNEAELYRRVDEVVHYIWDPIGVRCHPEARDEYQSYLTAIYGRVKAGNKEDILEYMRWASGDNMGLTFDKAKAEEAVEVLLEWKRVIDERT